MTELQNFMLTYCFFVTLGFSFIFSVGIIAYWIEKIRTKRRNKNGVK